ncbi:3-deoxy-manno-octulosonate cytidylyltransferase [Planctomycetota bacterium]|nr:3-deoxy-manno-octulosonate cytidylyltransferase [Planctomycetota bacterium]
MIAILIPARRASTRLPEKLLLAEHGEPLIATAARQAALAFGAESVVVCCDDPALADAARTAGVAARLTRPDHASGTDRIAEVAAGIDAKILVNVQGDEPEMDPEHIRLVAGLLERNAWAAMATLCVPAGPAAQANPNQVKVVLGGLGGPIGDSGREGRALWFTRAPAVWDRDAGGPDQHCFRHLGIYAYRREVLLGYARLPGSRLEQLEKLEQLRALEAGLGIACAVVDQATPGIDIRADYDAFLARWRSRRDSQHAPIHS